MKATPVKPPLLLRQLSPAQLQMLDVVHAGLVGVLCLFAAVEQPVAPASGWHEPAWVTGLTALLLCLPTAVRRRWPLPAAAVVVAVASAVLAIGVVPDYALAGPLVAVGLVLYVVGSSVPTRPSVVAAAGAVAALVVAQLFQDSSPSGPGAAAAAFTILVIASCWALGWTVRERRAHAARTAELATARAVDEERLRIAREVHDIVAHSMSLISVKATIANHVAADRPEEVRDALRVIEETSRTALVEMRRTLGALRGAESHELGADQSELTVLVEAARSAGLRVEFVRTGSAEMPDGLSTAVFRIVQESLTNVLKHAGARSCRVAVDTRDDGVLVEIVDDGRGGQDAVTGGQGLVGMRERVELYGGELYTGPGPDGGWMVRAGLEAVR